MKYAIVPLEPTEDIICGFAENVLKRRNQVTREEIVAGWKAALAARPPLDAEMQKALELARKTIADYAQIDMAYPERAHIKTGEERLARALLRANGKEG